MDALSGGTGKSYLTLHLAVRGCGPEAPARACGLTMRPGGVLLVSYEDALGRLGARLAALQARPDVPAADLSQLQIVPNPLPLWAPRKNGTGAELTPAFGALSARALADRPSLIVIDPLSAAAGGVNVNEGGAQRSAGGRRPGRRGGGRLGPMVRRGALGAVGHSHLGPFGSSRLLAAPISQRRALYALSHTTTNHPATSPPPIAAMNASMRGYRHDSCRNTR